MIKGFLSLVAIYFLATVAAIIVSLRHLTGQSLKSRPLERKPRSVILFQLEFSLQEEGLGFRLRSWEGPCQSRAPMIYGYFYPTFCPAAQGGVGLGRGVRRRHPAAMPRLRARFDRRPRATPQAGA